MHVTDSLTKLISRLLVKQLGLLCTLVLPTLPSVPDDIQNPAKIVQPNSEAHKGDTKQEAYICVVHFCYGCFVNVYTNC